jgi:hypothetical protein
VIVLMIPTSVFMVFSVHVFCLETMLRERTVQLHCSVHAFYTRLIRCFFLIVGISTRIIDAVFEWFMVFHQDVVIVLQQHFADHVLYVKKQEN